VKRTEVFVISPTPPNRPQSWGGPHSRGCGAFDFWGELRIGLHGLETGATQIVWGFS
jgi:hypothetical protein